MVKQSHLMKHSIVSRLRKHKRRWENEREDLLRCRHMPAPEFQSSEHNVVVSIKCLLQLKDVWCVQWVRCTCIVKMKKRKLKNSRRKQTTVRSVILLSGQSNLHKRLLQLFLSFSQFNLKMNQYILKYLCIFLFVIKSSVVWLFRSGQFRRTANDFKEKVEEKQIILFDLFRFNWE